MPDSAPAPERRKRGRATEVDARVGRQIRSRRMLLGMSQSELAGSLGITFQQLQKYERGLNRVGAGRLFELSQVLQTPVGYFFVENGTEDAPLRFPENAQGRYSQREISDLVRAYYAISDRAVRRRVLDLVRAIAGADTGESEGEPALPVTAH